MGTVVLEAKGTFQVPQLKAMQAIHNIVFAWRGYRFYLSLKWLASTFKVKSAELRLVGGYNK